MIAESELQGKTALITGAARRVGRATAMALAQRGATVVLHYNRSEVEATALLLEIEALGGRASTVQADLSSPAKAALLVKKATDAAGALDFLINNASVFEQSTLDTVTPEEINRSVDLHALTPLVLSREFARQTTDGCIINLLDTKIREYDRAHVAYHLGKKMLHSLTRMLAVELAPSVRVNAIAPGLVLPPEGEGDAYLRGLAHTNPLQRHGGAGDVTAAILFLLQSNLVTGQTIYVDGGRNLSGGMYD